MVLHREEMLPRPLRVACSPEWKASFPESGKEPRLATIDFLVGTWAISHQFRHQMVLVAAVPPEPEALAVSPLSEHELY